MFKYKSIPIADAGFVINLPNRTDRKLKSTRLLDDLQFNSYSFVDGYMFSELEWKKFGCTQAYLNIFEQSLLLGYESIMVFEDDIKLMNGVTSEDLDKIFYKWNFFSKKYDVIALGTRPLPNSKIKIEDPNFGKLYSTLCTQSFYYKKPFMRYVLDNLKDFKSPDSPYYKCVIDEFINDSCSHNYVLKQKNKIFDIGITIPMIFTQDNSYSDNEGYNQNYDEWMEECFNNAIKID